MSCEDYSLFVLGVSLGFDFRVGPNVYLYDLKIFVSQFGSFLCVICLYYYIIYKKKYMCLYITCVVPIGQVSISLGLNGIVRQMFEILLSLISHQ